MKSEREWLQLFGGISFVALFVGVVWQPAFYIAFGALALFIVVEIFLERCGLGNGADRIDAMMMSVSYAVFALAGVVYFYWKSISSDFEFWFYGILLASGVNLVRQLFTTPPRAAAGVA